MSVPKNIVLSKACEVGVVDPDSEKTVVLLGTAHTIAHCYQAKYSSQILFEQYDSHAARNTETINKCICVDVGSHFDDSDILCMNIKNFLDILGSNDITNWRYRMGSLPNKSISDMTLCMIFEFADESQAVVAKLCNQNALAIPAIILE